MWRTVFAIGSLVVGSAAYAIGLDDGDRIDKVFLNPKTGQAGLILGVDKPIDSEVIEKQVDYKLGTYIGYVRSEEIYRQFPNADRNERVIIAFILEHPPSPKVKQMLFNARARLLSLGFDVWLKVYDESTRRNVDIVP